MNHADELALLKQLLLTMRQRLTTGDENVRPIIIALEQLIAEREQEA